jgi:hypothetical protein
MIESLAKLHGIDRRWLYLGTVVILLIPLIFSLPMPSGKVSPTTKGIYDLVESCPDDKVILIDSSWDAGSAAENRAQLDCVVRHIVAKRKKFVVTSAGITPFAPEFADQVIRPIAEEAGYVYGKDWVNSGYKLAPPGGINLLIEAICRDFKELYPSDWANVAMSEYELMKDFKGIDNIHMVYCVTYSPPNEWISYVRGQFGTPVCFGCMTIAAPAYFTFIDSDQLSGMLIGNRGAAEYEGLNKQLGFGTRLIIATAFGNCVVIIAALMGNIGFWANSRLKQKATEGSR